MPKYVVTDLAGPWVAGRPNPGANVPITLSEAEADFEVKTGALRIWGEPIVAYQERAEAATAPDPESPFDLEPAPVVAAPESPPTLRKRGRKHGAEPAKPERRD